MKNNFESNNNNNNNIGKDLISIKRERETVYTNITHVTNGQERIVRIMVRALSMKSQRCTYIERGENADGTKKKTKWSTHAF